VHVRVLQCGAVHSSVLHCVALCCSLVYVWSGIVVEGTLCVFVVRVLQRVAACCSVLQRVALCCGVVYVWGGIVVEGMLCERGVPACRESACR